MSDRSRKTIKLSRTYVAFEKSFNTVTVREPTFNMLMELGEPYELHQGPSGLPIVVENKEALSAYVDRCIVEPPLNEVNVISLQDARAVRAAVVDFFRSGEPETAPLLSSPMSEGGPTNSPSNADSQSSTSAV